jgi:hypothetical protein
MKKLYVLVAWLACTSLSFAQGKYEKADLILSSGDTLKGYIQNKDWKVSPKTINFKKQLSDGSRRYDVSQIRSFYLHDSKELFEAATVAVDKSVSEDRNVNTDAIVAESALIKVLLKGEVSLYQYYDVRNHFFIQQGDEKMKELIIEKRTTNNNGVTGIQINEKFKYTLSAVFDDCPSLNREIQNSRLTTKSLMSLFQNYYLCKSKKPVYAETRTADKVQIGVLAGLSLTKYSISGGRSYQHVPYTSGASPAFGAYLNLVGTRNFESWSLYNDLLYQAYTVENKEPLVINEGLYNWEYNTFAKFAYLKLTSGPRYRFLNTKKVRPFLNGGVSVSVPIEKDAHTIIHRYTTTSSTFEKEEYETRPVEIGLWGGGGFQYNRWSFELRLERPKGWSKYSSMRVITDNTYFLISYRLSKE